MDVAKIIKTLRLTVVFCTSHIRRKKVRDCKNDKNNSVSERNNFDLRKIVPIKHAVLK